MPIPVTVLPCACINVKKNAIGLVKQPTSLGTRDTSPSAHAQFRAFQDDIRVKSVWSYGGQVRFKLQDSETVYKTKSLSDTFESIVKH